MMVTQHHICKCCGCPVRKPNEYSAAEQEKVQHLEQMLAGYASYHSIEAQLAAAQVAIFELRKSVKWLMEWQVKNVDKWDNSAYDNGERVLSLPTNLDALHEALAQECERLADLWHPITKEYALLREEAAAHRAKKGGK